MPIIALVLLAANPAKADDQAAVQGGLPELTLVKDTSTKPNKINTHYELTMSDDDALCKPLTGLYNELLVDPTKECWKNRKNGKPIKVSCEYRPTNFEEREPEKFAKIGLIEPPTKEIEFPLPTGTFPASYKEKLYLVDFFNEGKPRIVEYDGQMGDGRRTESTQVIVLKKNTGYNADIDNPNFIEFTTPKEYETTARLFISSGRPYFIVNHYTFVPIR